MYTSLTDPTLLKFITLTHAYTIDVYKTIDNPSKYVLQYFSAKLEED